MTTVELKSNEKAVFDLEFTEPMRAKNLDVMTLEPNGSGTKVTWTMSGRNNFLGKAFAMFFNMDELVGADFDKGLNRLAQVAEKQGTAP